MPSRNSVSSTCIILIISSFLQYTFRYKVLPGTVRFYDCANQILWNILVVCQQLLGVFWQAIASISKRRIIIMIPDSSIHANTVNDLSGIQTMYLRIAIKLIKETDSQRKIGIGKQFDRLCLCCVSEQNWDIFFHRSIQEQLRKLPRFFCHQGDVFQRTHNNTGRMQIVIQSMTFPQEFRAEENPIHSIFLM